MQKKNLSGDFQDSNEKYDGASLHVSNYFSRDVK